MDAKKRIVVNTLVQYCRSVVNIVLSLYSTRLILSALGVDDYGIYAVVGGVVAMLGFITNALVVTTQRYISFHHGRACIDTVKAIFANSLLIHVAFAALMAAALLLVQDDVTHSWLNIHPGRLHATQSVYVLTVAILVATILSAPYKAVFIARENIVYISLVEIADSVLKLALAIYITHATLDRLVLYAAMMAFIQVANLVAFALYAVARYDECSLAISRKRIDMATVRDLLGFAGWTTYGTGVIVVRNQGIAILLNNVFGTVINAAYGIAFQVQSAMAFVSTSVLNAMNPQIMKAEGEGDRGRMLHLAMQESKYSAAFMMMIALPAMMEMRQILAFWLGEVPPGTEMFCTYILLAFISDQLTYGLNTANQATGHIRTYSILMYTPKLLILPMAAVALHMGHGATGVMAMYLGVEVMVSVLRLAYMRRAMGLGMTVYARKVIVPLLPLAAALLGAGAACVELVSMQYRFVLTICLSMACGGMALWMFTMSHGERHFAMQLIRRKGSRQTTMP